MIEENAMELIAGQMLSDRIAQGRLPYAEIVRIVIETAQALHHSATLGVVHGDVKPANVMLDRTRAVKLTDFGLATATEASATDSDQTGAICVLRSNMGEKRSM
ncbi:MAG: protein kinase [Planctomycetaceae bacterium]|nr:protein kinase [Planctomycetaceae bacterium]